MGTYSGSATNLRSPLARPRAGACLITVDAGGVVRRWTKDAEVVFGYPTERADGLPVERLIPFLRDPEAVELEGWCRRADGSVFRGMVAALSGQLAEARGDAAAHHVFVVTDITSLYMREQSLAAVQRTAAALADRAAEAEQAAERQLIEVTEQLQRRIGQDLHDGLGQLLTGTAFLAKGLQHGLAAEHQPQVQRIVELINLAIARVRSLARGLSPFHVDTQSLEVVLGDTVREACELLGVACELEVAELPEPASATVAAQLCLIAREAITNAVRHGHAKHIVVRVERRGEQSVLSVEDDGVGITDLDKPLDGLGLRNMRYRARVIAGQLEVVRTPQGTTVRCTWGDAGNGAEGPRG